MTQSLEIGFDCDGMVIVIFKDEDRIEGTRSVPIDKWKEMILEMERAIANL